MTPVERAALQRIRARPARRYGFRPLSTDLTMGGIIGLLAGSVPAAVALGNRNVQSAAWLWIASAVLGAGIAAGVYWKTTATMRERRALYEWELSEGVVTEFDCRVTDAVEVYQAQTERTTYLLQVDSSRVLYLDGEYLYDAAHDGFPNEHFRLARAPHSWQVLTLECTGARLTSVRLIEHAQLRRTFDDGEMADGLISDYVRPG